MCARTAATRFLAPTRNVMVRFLGKGRDLFAISALMFPLLALKTGAQRVTPVGLATVVSAQQSQLDLGSFAQAIAPPADTAATRAPRALPFVLGGALIGAAVGGILAASYSLCDSDPGAGVYCTSTDPATGAIIGIAVGAAVGGLVWALVRYSRSAREAESQRSQLSSH
jgi:hypothetical protein